MARPTKSDEDNRTVIVRFRLTSSEKLRFWQDAKSHGQTPSDYFRSLALNARPAREVPTLERELLLKVLAETNKNGSNLNQIARVHNRMREDGEAVGISDEALQIAIDNVAALTTYLLEILRK